ncbi:MAG: methylenetetrahydrofolate--tRNA-(uracil(54)-C(5))-methyltransferase (FADH(2)-oxidizing) TrmFO [Desulfovibrionaceae bacterium]|nr:methylenetetrahydrofolate--tRNA-(uracil(54)-C(5))-methyltransferase (FADH(2)-oxidizing) TrmFO [Desulfovibrionaceae bacterium]
MSLVAVIGGGLAGCECAFKLARAGVRVRLLEMKPGRYSEAHKSPGLAELVCSNSLRSREPTTGVGLLKEEMAALGSLVMEAALACEVPAGKALAVDRERFSAYVTERIEGLAGVEVLRREVRDLDDPLLAESAAVVVAAGPLAGESLARSLAEAAGRDSLHFHDAIAPIVAAESIDPERVFPGSRYRPEDADYLNCPLDEAEYRRFVAELIRAERAPLRDFEQEVHFEGCLPVESMAERGEMTLAFGPLKPVGLVDPRTGQQPFAVVQLRPENRERTAFNLVGFQTRLRFGEQKRVFGLIPGLEQAEFLRLGSMHRNTFVDAPRVLGPDLGLKDRPGVFLAGQLTGVEGYVESAACGLWLGLGLARRLTGGSLPDLPRETALGALLGHLREPAKNFQPSNVHFGLMPALKVRAPKRRRRELYAERARMAFARWLAEAGLDRE